MICVAENCVVRLTWTWKVGWNCCEGQESPMAGAAPASAFTLYTPPGSDLTATAFSGPSSWETNLVLEFQLSIDT